MSAYIPETVIENQDVAHDEAHTEAFYKSDIFDGSTEVILDHLLSVPVPPEKLKTLGNPDSALNRDIGQIWSGEAEPTNLSILKSPRFIENTQPDVYPTLDAFKEAIHLEVQKRAEENHYLNLFKDLISRATRSEDFVKLVDIRDFFLEYSDHRNIALGSFMNRISNRSVELVEDPDYGDASPIEAAEIILPATRHLLELEHQRTDQESDEINIHLSSTLLNNRSGTAEDITQLRLRDLLSADGYQGFGATASAKRQAYLSSERYITKGTLLSVRKALSEYGYIGLPEGVEAISDIHGTVVKTLKILADPAHVTISQNPNEAESSQRIANSILGAYDKLKHAPKYGGQKGVPLNTPVKIANILTPDLNEREGLVGEQALEPLQEDGYVDLPAAFQRILFAINPRFLREATEGSIKETNSQLRLVMVYIDALAQQWTDYQKLQPGLSVGDYVLRLNANGYSSPEIADQLEAISTDRPDRKASDHIANVIDRKS